MGEILCPNLDLIQIKLTPSFPETIIKHKKYPNSTQKNFTIHKKMFSDNKLSMTFLNKIEWNENSDKYKWKKRFSVENLFSILFYNFFALLLYSYIRTCQKTLMIFVWKTICVKFKWKIRLLKVFGMECECICVQFRSNW